MGCGQSVENNVPSKAEAKSAPEVVPTVEAEQPTASGPKPRVRPLVLGPEVRYHEPVASIPFA